MEKETLSEKLKRLMEERRTTNVGLLIISLLLLTMVLTQFPGGFIIEALIIFGAIVVCYNLNKKKGK